MEMVQTTSGARIRIVRGNYTVGALARSPHHDLGVRVDAATLKVLAAERHHEDFERPVTFTIAQRDLIGAALEETAALVRLGLASRSRTATRESPFTDIFERTLAEYTEATVDEMATAMGLLVSRLEAHLPDDDPVRVQYVPILRQHIDQWNAARAEIVAAKEDLDLARQLRDNTLEAWDAVMVEVYGLLVARVGKRKADRYFTKAKSGTKRAAPKPTPSDAETDAGASSPRPELQAPTDEASAAK